MWSIGPFHVNFFGIAFAFAIFSAVLWSARAGKRWGMKRDTVYDLSLWAAFGGIIGARMIHVLLEWPTYAGDLISALYVWRGGLSWHGGLLGGGIAAAIYLKRKGLPILPTADALVAALPLGQAIGRVGCDIYGTPAEVPWAVTVGGQRVHPQQAYEILWDWGLFLLLAYLGKKRQKRGLPHWYRPGYLTLLYAVLSSVGRFGVEYFRPSRMLGPFSDGQWVSLAIILAAAVFFVVLRHQSRIHDTPDPKRRTRPAKAAKSERRFYPAVGWIAGTVSPVLLILLYFWRVQAGIV